MLCSNGIVVIVIKEGVRVLVVIRTLLIIVKRLGAIIIFATLAWQHGASHEFACVLDPRLQILLTFLQRGCRLGLHTVVLHDLVELCTLLKSCGLFNFLLNLFELNVALYRDEAEPLSFLLFSV